VILTAGVPWRVELSYGSVLAISDVIDGTLDTKFGPHISLYCRRLTMDYALV
jgi:hypothetical protein